MTWKRYRYDGDEEIIFLDTAEGARVLSPGDTVIVDDQHDLDGRPFTAVGGKLPDDLPPAPPAPPAPAPADAATAPVDAPAAATPDPTAQPTVDTNSAPGAGSE